MPELPGKHRNTRPKRHPRRIGEFWHEFGPEGHRTTPDQGPDHGLLCLHQLSLLPLGDGRCLAYGRYGKASATWIALLSWDGSSKRIGIERLYETTRTLPPLLDKPLAAMKVADSLDLAFDIPWVCVWNDPDRPDERVAIVGRICSWDKPDCPLNVPLAIDLQTKKVSLLAERLPGLAEMRSAVNAVCVRGSLFLADDKGIEGFIREAPGKFRRQRLVTTPQSRFLVPLGNSMYSPGLQWYRIDLGEDVNVVELGGGTFPPREELNRFAASANFGLWVSWDCGPTVFRVDPEVPCKQVFSPFERYVPDERIERHLKAVEAIRKFGGRVRRVPPFPAIGRYSTDHTVACFPREWKGGDEGLRHLKDLYDVEAVYFLNTPVTNEGMKHLSSLDALSELHLVETSVTTEGLKRLDLRRLWKLHLEGNIGGQEFGNETLKLLEGSERIASLCLYGPGFDAQAIEIAQEAPPAVATSSARNSDSRRRGCDASTTERICRSEWTAAPQVTCFGGNRIERCPSRPIPTDNRAMSSRHMITTLRYPLLVLGLAICLPACRWVAADEAEPDRPAVRQTVFLGGDPLVKDPRRTDEREWEGTMDEAIRQAVLIAARDELGCITRDFWLGESISSDDACFYFQPEYAGRAYGGIVLTLHQIVRPGKPPAARTRRIPANLGDTHGFDLREFGDRLDRLELASRNELVEMLREFGLHGEPNSWRDSAAVPPEIVERLKAPTFTSQFAAVRSLHRLLREDGESPERLAALVEGYLHLSYLTECYFHPMHEVFKIRAVLYAYRLTNKRKRFERFGRGIRFATLTLAGFHQDAVQTWRSRMNRNPSQPVWLDLAEPCLEYDLKTFSKHRKNPAFGPWAKLYEFRTLKYADSAEKAMRLCAELMDEHPRCHMLRSVPFGSPRFKYLAAQETASRHLGKELYDQLVELPNLPDVTAELAAEGCRLKEATNASEEYAVRDKLAALLTAADGCGSPEKDPQELSWQVLGAMVRELSFSQVFWRAFFLRYAGPSASATTANEWIENTDALTCNHRFRPLLDIHGDQARRNAAFSRLPKNPEELKELFHRVLRRDYPLWLLTLNSPQGADIWKVLSGRTTLPDLPAANINTEYNKAVLACITTPPVNTRSHGAPYVARSPYNPWALYFLTKDGDIRSREIVESRWDLYEEFPEVRAALGMALCKHGEYREAIRRLEAVRSDYPEADLYVALGEAYRHLGDDEAFYRTVDAYCELPTAKESNKAVLQLQAAFELLRNRDRDGAVERLSTVAKNDDLAGRLAHSTLLQLRGQFDETARALEPSARMGAGPYLDWYWARLRTQAGVDTEAEGRLKSLLDQYRTPGTHGFQQFRDLVPHYMVAMTTVKTPAVRDSMDGVWRWGGGEEPDSTLCRMVGFLHTPMEQDETKGLEHLHEIQRKSRQSVIFLTTKHVVALANVFLRDLEDGKGGDLNTAQLEDLIAEADLSDRAHLLYFIGAYYNRYGQEDRAVEYWKRAVPLPLLRNDGRNLAIYELRKRGMTDEEYRELIDSWFEETP